MRFCVQCGNQLPEGAKFCNRCGHPVGVPAGSAPGGSQRPDSRNESKKKRKGLAVGIVVAVLVVVALAAAVIFWLPGLLSGNSDGGKTRPSREITSTRERESRTQEEERETVPQTERESADAEETTHEAEREESKNPSFAERTEAETAHTYQVVRMDCSWEEAAQTAEELGGYLAEIEDEAEYETILADIEADGCGDCSVLYVGAAREADSEEYHWLSDPDGIVLNSAGYWMEDYWMVVDGVAEPTFQETGMDVREDCLALYQYDGHWRFNDMSRDFARDYNPVPHQGKMGFVVEFEE